MRNHETTLDNATTPEPRPGLGGFLSLWGLVVISLSIGAVVKLVDEYRFSQETTPVEIEASTPVVDLADGAYVRVTGRLDYERAILSDKAAGDAYLVAPLQGSDLRLWVSLKDGVIPATQADITCEGRIREKGSAGWEIGDARELDLRYHGKKLLSIEVAESALVLQDGVRPGDDMTFHYVAGGAGLIVLLIFLRRLLGVFGAMVRPSRRDGRLVQSSA